MPKKPAWYIREDGQMVCVLDDGKAELLPPMTIKERNRLRAKKARRHEASLRAARTKKELYG